MIMKRRSIGKYVGVIIAVSRAEQNPVIPTLRKWLEQSTLSFGPRRIQNNFFQIRYVFPQNEGRYYRDDSQLQKGKEIGVSQ